MSSLKITSLVSATLLLFAVNAAQAVELYKCESSVKTKSARTVAADKVKKDFLLVDGYRSLINFYGLDTRLDIAAHLQDSPVHAYLTEGPYYLNPAVTGRLDKTVHLESKSAEVSVRCNKAPAAEYVFMDNFTRAASLEPRVSACYLGNAEKAAQDYIKKYNLSPIASVVDSAGSILLTTYEKYCARGEGTNHDDYECYEYGMHNVTYEIESCEQRAKKIKVCSKFEVQTGPARHPDEDYSRSEVCVEHKNIVISK